MTLTPEILLQAYRAGIFPMAEHRDDPEIFWVDPRQRGVIPMKGFRISRSLARRLRKDDYEVTFDRDFEGVIDACADRRETWINSEIRALFTELHRRGIAHSIEVWMDGALVGGVYGLEIGGAFCGESMFSRRRDGSKIALAWLIDLLRRAGFTLFDTQFLTTHLASLGAVEIPRHQYRAQLAMALEVTPDLAGTPLAASGQEVVQRSTQTS
ncbi:leucyl/phenylalanyl-tRNA--protein transferase [Salipiger sp. PrR002]|uniref:leucyl/phenylalanyl-tRNA--protein transferase n=1 Tax=Salipiger sp. PrR002 TaxID=2706489 RepID=UPI0013B8F7A0|nr:leucyl/phenylalanyl-tRNA--protein transferase [Salipiger sp. PrR002]NDW00731.1 leucyl/phenylalanyl-tRNA--protein transferase [Salipiger sp. PrR002]NDW57674.1 leucyl/phenylalanyl-tRNA--protein transferase [Salipiger sp. PrR004]